MADPILAVGLDRVIELDQGEEFLTGAISFTEADGTTPVVIDASATATMQMTSDFGGLGADLVTLTEADDIAINAPGDNLTITFTVATANSMAPRYGHFKRWIYSFRINPNVGADADNDNIFNGVVLVNRRATP